MSKFSRAVRKTPRLWWYLVNFWSLVIFAAIIFNFVQNGIFDEITDALLVIYIALLAIYAGDKEFERWHNKHAGRHPGEVFVFLWTILVIAIGSCQYFFNKPVGLTNDIVAAYIAVLSVLAVTRRSKAIYAKQRG